ncbi:MAG: dksA [Panacagrimonas sp.]|jgi:DnaK suppressor protein|nr:TraR/DksA C4-type zinc finger protein [Panacagrimonas sp.]MCC2655276.1 dksA [Panacagrimonas sp.]
MPFDTQPFMHTEDSIRNAPDEDYMNAAQLAFFRTKLLEMREELLRREEQARAELVDAEAGIDMNDRATHEEQAFLASALREREQRELQEVESALARVATGDYGWCERTGEPIGIPRLLARPAARTTIRSPAPMRQAA